ncbi:hypothetical protein ACFSO7_01125 [Bacillus sp. CGMCC 1.16607]|uniref:hypothetical protein n=1 Tax=Bacillus sp. CGMCC 1.16607 TaxID=3351842 RepID=UPI003629CE80
MNQQVNELCNPHNSPFFSILKNRILNKNIEKGWEGLIDRIIDATTEVENKWNLPDKNDFLNKLRSVLSNSEFLPNSPLMVNISEPKRRLFACFALDARKPMTDFLITARNIHDGMGGVGYSLDHYKEPADISEFIKEFDSDTVANQEGRPRPASNAVTISIDNPGVEAIFEQAGNTKVTNLNVGITEEFMSRLILGEKEAQNTFKRLANSIHKTGQPAIVFTDRIPQISLEEQAPFAANVCGESPLAADESALLGSLNLVKFIKPSEQGGSFTFDEGKFKEVVSIAVRFLDDMHEIHDHASPELKTNTLATRKIGVGIMGFAHMIALLGIRYGSQESILLAENIGKLIMESAKEESEKLSMLHDCFPAFNEGLGIKKRRNALLSAIAQTSTLSLLVNTSSGIEPIYSHYTKQNILGHSINVLDPIIEYYVKQAGLDVVEVTEKLQSGILLETILGPKLAGILPCALNIPGDEQIEVQAAFQRYIDGGISKTLNCPNDTPIDQIEKWILKAYESNVLGLMIYRDGSIIEQPLEGVK